MSYESPEERLDRLEKTVNSLAESTQSLLSLFNDSHSSLVTVLTTIFVRVTESGLYAHRAMIANSGLLPDKERASLMQEAEKEIADFNVKKIEVLSLNDPVKLIALLGIIPPLPSGLFPPKNPPRDDGGPPPPPAN